MTRWTALVETCFADGSFAERVCLVLIHSLWQFALLALLVWMAESFGRRLSSAVRYKLYLALLLVGLTAVPMTLGTIVRSEAARLAALQLSRPARLSFLAPADGAAAPFPVLEEASAETLDTQALSSEVPAQQALAAKPSRGFTGTASRWIAALYGLGVCAMLGRLVRGVWQCQRVTRKAQPIVNEALLTSLSDIAVRWKLRYLPRLLAAHEVAMPCVMGLLRPTIIFPLAALNSLSPSELEMILAHELAHVRRRDLWAHLVQRLAEALLFFNPGMWYVSRRISLLREHCCDELACERTALECSSADAIAARIDYAQALVRLAEVQFTRSNRAALEQLTALAAAGNSPSQLRRRILALLGEPVREPLRVSRSGLMTLTLLAIALLLTPALVVSSGQAVGAIALGEAGDEPSDVESIDKHDEQLAPQVDTHFVKRLPSGVEVKLLAVGTRGEPVQRWWLPDGTPLAGEPYHVKDFERYSFPGPLTREVVFTMEKVPEEASYRFRTRPQGPSMGSGGVADADGNRLRYHHAHITPLVENAKSFGFEVGVAAGAWETIAALPLPRGASPQVNGDVVFAGPYVSPVGRAVLTVSHSLEGQVRLVSVYKRGYRSPQVEWLRTGSGEKLFVSQFELGGPLDLIERVEFQTRPYEWMSFDDLPAHPDTVAEHATASKVRVLAIGYGDLAPAGQPRWWNAEGTPCEAPQSRFNGQRNSRLLPDPRARQVVWELPKYHSGAAIRFEISSKNGWSRGELTRSELESAEGQGKIMHEVHAIDSDSDTFSLRVGVSDGTWQTVYSGDAGAAAQGNHERKGVVFSEIFAQGDGSAVVVSHNWDGQNTRLVAIDKVAKKHTGKFSSHLTAVETVNQTIFEFENLKPADVAKFEFQVQDFAWTTIDNLPANPKPAPDAKAAISGRIRLADGSASTQEAWLEFLHRGENGNSSIATRGPFKERYSFSLPAGTLWYTLFVDGFAPATAGPIRLRPGEQLSDFDLVLRPGVTWHLKFQNENGDPVSATVTAIPYLGDSQAGPAIPRTAGANGALALEHLTQAVAYHLAVSAAGYQPTSVNLPTSTVPPNPDDTPILITLRKARPATGIVRLSNGEPARGAQLTIRAEVTPTSGIATLKTGIRVDQDGRFAIDELADGKYYLVMAEAADGARVMLPPVVAGNTDIDVTIPPRRDLKIHLIGDLDKLTQRQKEPKLSVRQRYDFRATSSASFGDLISADILVEATDDGGTAIYRGLIDEPVEIQAGQETYSFDRSEGEVTINLDAPPGKNRY